MLINFLQIAIRNALRQKTYTLINILGLSIGITASILISLWVFDELSFDRYFQDADRMYRIDLYQQIPQTRTPYPMAQAMVQDFPEVLKATSLTPVLDPNFSKPTFAVEYQDIRFDEKNIVAGDTNFFDVFSFEFIMGNPNTAFLVPHAIIITREISEKYFGNENAIGKMLRINDELDFMVTGVLEDLPPNIHFHFDFMISYAFMKQMETGEWFTWSDPGHYNYVVLKPDVNVSELQGKLPEWFMQYTDYGEEFEQQLTEGTIWFQLTHVRDIHLHSNIRWELETNGNISYVYIFLFSSLLILIVAIINYMNLSTARYSHKSREVAVRKTTGASRARLIQQFQVESFLQSLASVIIAVFFTEILINSFSNLTGKDFYFIYSQTELYLLALLFLAVIIGLLTGSYPSFYLSSFSPLEVLRRKSHAEGSVVTIRIILVVFQFTASIFLIIGTLTIFNQL